MYVHMTYRRKCLLHVQIREIKFSLFNYNVESSSTFSHQKYTFTHKLHDKTTIAQQRTRKTSEDGIHAINK